MPTDFSAFFDRHKYAPINQEKRPPPSLNGWDEEGVFDLDDPVVEEPLTPEIVPEKEKPENNFSRFFSTQEDTPKREALENFKGDLFYAARSYVDSVKYGNPLTLAALASMTDLKEEELKKAFAEKKWVHFFEQFGMSPPEGSGKIHLDDRMMYCLQRVTDPLDTRKLNTILKEIGISNAEFRMWMRQPEFKDLYTKWTKDGMRDVQGEVARQVTAKATQGDPRAIETYLKLNGVNLQQTNNDVLVPFLLKELQQLLPREQLSTFVTKLKELTAGNGLAS